MATYTSILKLIKQAFKDAAWHTNLNTTLDLVDEALSYKSIAITGNTTLTLTDGVSSDVRRMFLEFTGTLAANATITIPALAKNFRVKNSTTGGFSLVFTTGSGNTVTVANGDTAPLWSDGTNVSLAIGTAGLRATGTSGATIPLLNGANTFSGENTFSAKQTFTKSIETAKGADVSSASPGDVWTNKDGNYSHITGTTTITDWGTAPQAGATRVVIFDGALQLTDGANQRINGGGSNYTTAAGDIAVIYADTTTAFKVTVFPRSGKALVGDAGAAKFTSSEITFASGVGESNVVAHGLGKIPIVKLFLRCKTADSGWSVNDEILLDYGNVRGALAVGVDSTNITLILDSASPHFEAPHKTTFGVSSLVDASWALVIRCW